MFQESTASAESDEEEYDEQEEDSQVDDDGSYIEPSQSQDPFHLDTPPNSDSDEDIFQTNDEVSSFMFIHRSYLFGLFLICVVVF